MIRLMVLEWREVLRDARSWMIALLPLLFFSAARFTELAGGATPFDGGVELFHFALPALMFQMTLLADLFAQQRVRGELELLRLLPLSPLQLLAAKLGAVWAPVTVLLALQLGLAAAVLRRFGVLFSSRELLFSAALLVLLVFVYGLWGARLSLSGGSLRGAVARLFLLLLGLIVAAEAALLLVSDSVVLSILLLLFLAGCGIWGGAGLLKRWNRPETWLAD